MGGRPAIVNAEIKRRIELQISMPNWMPPKTRYRGIAGIVERRQLKPYGSRADSGRFGVNSEGLIDVVPDPPAPGTR